MILIAFALLLTSQQAALRSLVDQDVRVATIGTRLALAAGQDFCPGQSLSLAGLIVQDAEQYSADTRDDARIALGLGEGPTVVGVVAGTPTGGAQIGDSIVSVNGIAVPMQPPTHPYARVAQVEAAVEGAKKNKVVIVVRRGSATLNLVHPVAAGCSSRFQIIRGGLGATQADGRYVTISDRMMKLAPTDEMLAALIAHELAHNILRHNQLKTPSKRAEYEADRLSVWLVAKAGYDLNSVLPFWAALRKRADYGIFADGTHPSWPKRIAALEVALAEVRAQQAAGQPLVPSRQEGASQPQKAR